MPVITLPDGSQRLFDQAISIMDVAKSIGTGLAKATLAGKVDGKLVDAATIIEHDASLQIITSKDEEGIEVIRHSTAHLLAQAVKQLFPAAQVTIGPVVENGFYYDFAYERSFSPEDLSAIEKRMQDLAAQDIAVSRSVLSRDEAVSFFEGLGEKYKAEIIASIPANEDLSLYNQGDFTDLCRGPHVPSTGRLKAFKLMKIAGAYWRGDSKNEMLQRIYGTAWGDVKELAAYLHRLEEAEKRDHRKIGKTLDLFHAQEEAPGMVFWHDKGWAIYQQVEQYIREKLRVNGYGEVRTPQIVDRSLWEKSGHWDKFSQMMFTTQSESRDYAVKPMNCPCHIQIYNQGIKSYRDLPVRLAEFGSCHRNEPSGTLHGLMRVRNFVQDDAHIFCTPEQIISETKDFCDLLKGIYKDLGFDSFKVRFSDRPEKRAGTDELWDKAEEALKAATQAAGIEYSLNPGEGAFYGPKLEFVLKDCIGREWQCGTLQVDYSIPERLDATYVGEDGQKHRPVMLHRAVLGSMERFIGVLIEHYAGKFPVWLAPVQVVVASVTTEANEYAINICEQLKAKSIRAELDIRNEKIPYKVREHSLQKIPYIYVVGKREAEEKTVAIRKLGGEQQNVMSFEQAMQELYAEANAVG